MKIQKIPSYTIFEPKKQISFAHTQTAKISETKDKFQHKNFYIQSYELSPSGNKLKRVTFEKPVHVSEALNSLINHSFLSERLLYAFHTKETLFRQSEDLKKLKELSFHKVKALIGVGVFALAFETENGQILKVTSNEHFPANRKQAFFDLPILKHGSANYTQYYLEEKVSQDNISQEELRAFVKTIKAKGYTMQDYLVHYDFGDLDNVIRKDQFGKTAEGKLYLIDPGCALAPPKHFFDVKRIAEKALKMFRRN